MAASGFEGFEKRLQLDFSITGDPLGLRRLSAASLRLVLDAVGCSIVSAAGNRHFDAYVLSESSLFVYPRRIIIKTCGTTRLLNSVPLLLHHAAQLPGAPRPSFCRYSRGSFIFPDAQPYPYNSPTFRHEVELLDRALPPELAHRKASVSSSQEAPHSWHVYSAAAAGYVSEERFTVEVCMTELDRGLAGAFYRKEKSERGLSGDEVGREMTEGTGVGDVNPRSLALGFAFDPCGYSMNGLDRDRYSTVHVTPEEGYSYASFECAGGRWEEEAEETAAMLAKAVRVFGPGSVSVSVSGGSSRSETVWSAVENAVGAAGLECRTRAAEYFPGVGQVTYQTFAAAAAARRE